MSAVPCLAQACVSLKQQAREKTPAGAPAGSHLKTMRLLSKDMEKVMAGYVHSCSIELGGKCSTVQDNLQALVNVSRFSRLSSLKVVVLKPKSEFSTLKYAADVSRQVEILISVMGTALPTIMRLELDVQDICSNAAFHARDKVDDLVEHTSTLTEVLTPLAMACPAVEQLHVAGSVGRSVLAALSTSCKLTSLEIGSCDVPIASLERLHLLLPRLSHLKLLPPSRVFGRFDERQPRFDPFYVYQGYANHVLRACYDCQLLTDLDAPWVMEGGTSLPVRLQHACLAGADSYHGNPNPPPQTGRNAELQALTLHCERSTTFDSVLARVLEASPLLTSLRLVTATECARPLTCMVLLTSCVIALQERTQQGLTISAFNSAGTQVELCLVICAEYTFLGQDVSQYPDVSVEHSDLEQRLLQLSSCQVTVFQRLVIADAIAGHSFYLLPKIFPQITFLVFSRCALGPVELRMLASFTSLLHLEFNRCRDLTTAALSELFAQLPLLKCVGLEGCSRLSREDAKALQAHLGQAVAVEYVE